MAVVMTEPAATTQPTGSRWALGYAWIGGLVAYCIAILLTSDSIAPWINNIAWTVTSGAAMVTCFYASRRVDAERRSAWFWIGIACTSWFLGQIHWDYSQLVLGVDLPVESIGQLLFSLFAVFVIIGMFRFPEARERPPFTLKHVGNLGLVLCCLMVTVVLGMLEPALQIGVPSAYLWIGIPHTVLVAATFLVALFALWTYRWGASWTPMLLLVIAMGIYAVSNLIYAHSLLTGTYQPNDLINVTWLVLFGLIAIAAREQVWLSQNDHVEPPQRMQRRERWLEAVVPALLIIIMVFVAVSVATLTPRVIAWSAALFVLFAIILGAREAWIQNESQQLMDRLVAINEQLQSANSDLRHSEARYRELATVLEQRVMERTTELKRAYDQLEGFSYAVAHDLKAPLRAINGFAHLFEVEMSAQLSPRALEHLARIRNGSLKMATLIDDLLAYSHVDRRGMQLIVVALPTLIDSALAHYADEIQRRGIAVATTLESVTARVDAEGLSLALRNLLENALKYTRDRQNPRIDITCRRTEEGVLLTIADNGIGFDMEYHDHIFKIFQRLHRDDQYPGTGIGLALVHKAVERIGGRVWAQSNAGEGATFFIELPETVLV
jgi:signal transduction histidine kinase